MDSKLEAINADTRNLAVFRAERDAIAFLGVLSHMYLSWDPQVVHKGGSAADVTHFSGLNIHAAVIDNGDGEVLGLDRNTIHQDGSPLQHAEQHAIRTAIARISQKRPRGPGTTVEENYRSRMFYLKGTDEATYVDGGCTLYTSLQPCPMCAATLLVVRMKRSCYIVPDAAFGMKGGIVGYDWLHTTFYGGDDVKCEPFQGDVASGGFVGGVAEMHARLLAAADEIRASGARDTQIFDHLRSFLAEVFAVFTELTPGDLTTDGKDRERNLKTLADLKSGCNIPMSPTG